MVARGANKTNPLSAWIAVAAVVVASLFGITWQAATYDVDVSPLRVDRPFSAAPAASVTGLTRVPKTGVESDYAEMLARPLFSPSRRPAAPSKNSVADVLPAPSQPPLQAKLIGLMTTPARGQRALIRPTDDKTGTWLAIGDDMRGWRLREISTDRVVFERSGRQQELQLEVGTSAAPKAVSSP